MDTAVFFVKGLIAGFLVAAPVGPVAVMCIHRTIAHGRLAGYVCGLGATLGDTVFGAIAALGLGFVASELIANQEWLRLVGGAVLCAIGFRLLLSRHLPHRAELMEEEEEREDATAGGRPHGGLLGNGVTAFVVMITNPLTLISFAAIFAAMEIGDIGQKARWGFALVAGVFAGGGAWWTAMVTVSGLLRHHIGGTGFLWVNRCSGAVILAFGALLLVYPGTLGERGHDASPPAAVMAPARF